MEKPTFGERKIIIYDDKEIHYIEAYITEINIEQHWHEYDGPKGYKKAIPTNRTYTFNTVEGFDTDMVKLDETTMRRIAKYNKEKELQKIEEKIKEKQNKIKELDDILQDRQKRVEKLKKYVAEIYDIDIADDEDNYEDYDY